MLNKKKGKAPESSGPESAAITYMVGNDKRTRELSVPVHNRSAHALLNAIEREGCTNISEVREQIRALPNENEER